VLELLKESAARGVWVTMSMVCSKRAAATAGRVVDEATDPDQDEILERIRTLGSGV
jgi:hypothetical protein